MSHQHLIEAFLSEVRAECGDRPPGLVRDIGNAFRMISRIGIRVTFAHAIAVALIRLHDHLIDRRLHAGIPQPLSADQFNENVSASVRSLKDVPFQPVSASQLAEVRALRARLQAQWHALPLGATLEVAWRASLHFAK